MRSEKEINATLNELMDLRHKPSKYPQMTFEEGIEAALDWVLENRDENPLEG